MRFISNNDGNTIASKKLQSEIDELTNQLGNTQLDLANETQTRETEDARLSLAIATEQSNRQTADGTLQNNIDTLGQDLQDYKNGIANAVNTRTVNANTVLAESLSAYNSAYVGNQLAIQKRGNVNSGIVIKTFDNAFVPDSNNWYLLAQWNLHALPEVECVFGQGSVSGGFKFTPEVIETKGNNQVQIALGVQGNNAILAIKGSCTIISFVAKYNKAYSFTANTERLTTVVEETDIQSTFAIDGHVYFNNPADPDTFTVNNTLNTVNANITNADITNETVDNSEIDVLENSKRNTKKDFITLATHATNTRYYIKIPKFNGSYTCTLIKGTEQLFSFEAVMHGDYCEVNYSSIDINEAQIDTYLEAFYIDGSGNLWFKTFGDGKLYYSYDAEGELAAPESYSNPPANPAITYNCAYHTRKVILSDGSSGIDIPRGSINAGNLSVNNLNADNVMYKNNPTGTGSFSLNRLAGSTVGTNSFAEGSNCTASGESSHAEGSLTTASGDYSHAEGQFSKATGNHSHAAGHNTTASGSYSHAEGVQTTASGWYSHAEGYETTASGNSSHAEGYETTASGSYSHAEGYNCTSSGSDSHAEGSGTTASAWYAHAEGDETTASGNSSHAEGIRTTASGRSSHTEGYETTASGVDSHAEGTNTIASGWYSHAEGYYGTASGDKSHVEGDGTKAASRCQHVQGKYNVEDTNNIYADIVGNGIDGFRKNIEATTWSGQKRLKGDVFINCNDDSTGGTALGASIGNLSNLHTSTKSSLVNAINEIYDNGGGGGGGGTGAVDSVNGETGDVVLDASDINYDENTTIAQKIDAVDAAKMDKANPTGTGSFSLNRLANSTIGDYSFAEGSSTTASGIYSHAEGERARASGTASHAEGVRTTASGGHSHSEGYETTASGLASHAEGTGTTASGWYSHAEGYYTTASGDKSHAEGAGTASGSYSHAEGYNTVASGDHSHAEGYETTASGSNSHAEGYGTKASPAHQHVQGKYNVEDTNNIYADIVGNGTNGNRKNIEATTWTGDKRLKGDVYINCNDDSTGGTALGASITALNTSIGTLSGLHTSVKTDIVSAINSTIDTTDIVIPPKKMAVLDTWYIVGTPGGAPAVYYYASNIFGHALSIMPANRDNPPTIIYNSSKAKIGYFDENRGNFTVRNTVIANTTASSITVSLKSGQVRSTNPIIDLTNVTLIDKEPAMPTNTGSYILSTTNTREEYSISSGNFGSDIYEAGTQIDVGIAAYVIARFQSISSVTIPRGQTVDGWTYTSDGKLSSTIGGYDGNSYIWSTYNSYNNVSHSWITA